MPRSSFLGSPPPLPLTHNSVKVSVTGCNPYVAQGYALTYCGSSDRCALSSKAEVWNANKTISDLFGDEGDLMGATLAQSVQNFSTTFKTRSRRDAELEMASCLAFDGKGSSKVQPAGCGISQTFWGAPPQASWVKHSASTPQRDVQAWEEKYGSCVCNVSSYWKMELVGQAGRGYPAPAQGMGFVNTRLSEPKKGMGCEVVTMTKKG